MGGSNKINNALRSVSQGQTDFGASLESIRIVRPPLLASAIRRISLRAGNGARVVPRSDPHAYCRTRQHEHSNKRGRGVVHLPLPNSATALSAMPLLYATTLSVAPS